MNSEPKPFQETGRKEHHGDSGRCVASVSSCLFRSHLPPALHQLAKYSNGATGAITLAMVNQRADCLIKQIIIYRTYQFV